MKFFTHAITPELVPRRNPLTVLVMLLLLPITGLQAQDFTYTNTNGAITVTGYTGPGGAVTIPSTIAGLPVTSIGDLGFTYNVDVTSVTIPNSVKNIGQYAFGGCSNLASITIGNGVTIIGGLAFSYCTSLTSVVIPDSVTDIKNGIAHIGDGGAFAFCTSLTNVTIGTSVTNIGDEAFIFCTSLVGVYFRGASPSLGQNAFDTRNNTTIYYLPGTIGWAATFAGHPTVLWNPQAQTSDASFGVHLDHFGFSIAGTADIPLVVEACTNLAARSWVPLQTCTLTNGLIYFSDAQWTNYPSRLYRIRSP